MTGSSKTLELRTSPHIASGMTVDRIMFHVVLAMLPTAAFAVYLFGLTGLLTLATAVLSCILTEHVLCRLSGTDTTLGDWSAVITGLLLGLTLPPGLPLWMAAAGGVIAIGLGKFLFGGLGSNPFNPALVGRAVLQAAFPISMTSWMAAFGSERFGSVPTSVLAWPFAAPTYDSVSAPPRRSRPGSSTSSSPRPPTCWPATPAAPPARPRRC